MSDEMDWQVDTPPKVFFVSNLPFGPSTRRRSLEEFAEGRQLEYSRSRNPEPALPDGALYHLARHASTSTSFGNPSYQSQPTRTYYEWNEPPYFTYIRSPLPYGEFIAYRQQVYWSKAKAYRYLRQTIDTIGFGLVTAACSETMKSFCSSGFRAGRYLLTGNYPVTRTYVAVVQVANGAKRRVIDVTRRTFPQDPYRNVLLSPQQRRQIKYREKLRSCRRNQDRFSATFTDPMEGVEAAVPNPLYVMSGALPAPDPEPPMRNPLWVPGEWVPSPERVPQTPRSMAYYDPNSPSLVNEFDDLDDVFVIKPPSVASQDGASSSALQAVQGSQDKTSTLASTEHSASPKNGENGVVALDDSQDSGSSSSSSLEIRNGELPQAIQYRYGSCRHPDTGELDPTAVELQRAYEDDEQSRKTPGDQDKENSHLFRSSRLLRPKLRFQGLPVRSTIPNLNNGISNASAVPRKANLTSALAPPTSFAPPVAPKAKSPRKRVQFYSNPITGKPVDRLKSYIIGARIDDSYRSVPSTKAGRLPASPSLKGLVPVLSNALSSESHDVGPLFNSPATKERLLAMYPKPDLSANDAVETQSTSTPTSSSEEVVETQSTASAASPNEEVETQSASAPASPNEEVVEIQSASSPASPSEDVVETQSTSSPASSSEEGSSQIPEQVLPVTPADDIGYSKQGRSPSPSDQLMLDAPVPVSLDEPPLYNGPSPALAEQVLPVTPANDIRYRKRGTSPSPSDQLILDAPEPVSFDEPPLYKGPPPVLAKLANGRLHHPGSKTLLITSNGSPMRLPSSSAPLSAAALLNGDYSTRGKENSNPAVDLSSLKKENNRLAPVQTDKLVQASSVPLSTAELLSHEVGSSADQKRTKLPPDDASLSKIHDDNNASPREVGVSIERPHISSSIAIAGTLTHEPSSSPDKGSSSLSIPAGASSLKEKDSIASTSQNEASQQSASGSPSIARTLTHERSSSSNKESSSFFIPAGASTPKEKDSIASSVQVDVSADPTTPNHVVVDGFEGLNLSDRKYNLRSCLKVEIEAQRRAEEKKRLAAEKARKEKEEAEEKARKAKEAEEALKKSGKRRMPVEKIIQPLSAEWDSKVDEALAEPMGKAVTSTSTGTTLTRRDIGKILPQAGVPGEDPRGWLNDDAVLAYLQAVVDYGLQRSGHKRGQTPLLHAFNAFFYNNLRSKGPDSIKRWAGKAKIGGKDLLKVEHVFIPVNHGGMHWTLLVVSPRYKRIEYFDSFHGDATEVLSNAKKWLKQELGDAFKESEWKSTGKAGPRQTNGSDCGVFTATTAKMIMLGVDPMAYSAADIPTQRRRMVAELLNRGLTGELEPRVVFKEERR